MPSISCLIPFYNEGNQILKVLEVISKVNGIDQIVAIDDGSTDLAFLKIQSKFPKVRLIRHQKKSRKNSRC
jgi:glycosyltransferase involved in cell wall biosynthesis